MRRGHIFEYVILSIFPLVQHNTDNVHSDFVIAISNNDGHISQVDVGINI